METIPKYYSNKDIFITGGTGFMGKVLIEKLLRSCPDLNRIFVLIRKKKEKPADERIRELLGIPLFDVVREENPKVMEKVFGIEGDIMSTDLGLSEESYKLMENVSIVFHNAASVRFDDPLKFAILLNTRGTRDVCQFATTLKKLEAFIYVSTTYCNPEYSKVEEKIYPPHGNWKDVIKVAENADPNIFEILMEKFTDHAPNTYTYSKAMGEQVCIDYKDQLPIVIFRPSIVTGTEREPFPGWCDNLNGPVGMLIACGFGILRTNYASGQNILHCIAVDVVIKSLIACAWVLGTGNQENMPSNSKIAAKSKSNEIKVYNCASMHSVTMKFLIQDGREFFRKTPFERTLWTADGGVTKCKFMNTLRVVFFQILPALVVDFFIRLSGNQPFLMRLQRKITHALLSLRVFVLTEWEIAVDNFLELRNMILPEDKEAFNLERSVESMDEYYTLQILGARRYILKEPDSNIPACKVRYERMVFIDKIIKYCFYAFIMYTLIFKLVIPCMTDPVLVLGNKDPANYF